MESFRARPFLMEQLLRPAKTGRAAHAQILSGPEGTGRHSAARFIAQSLNCTGEGRRPCGVCPSCLRFQNGDYTDLITVEPDGTQIKADQIRDLIGQLSVHGESGYRCVILYPADRMNEYAQNALLKTLEEAPENTVFFLITDRPGTLLSTIRSRCVQLRFSTIPEESVPEVLKEKLQRGDRDITAAFRKRTELWQKQFPDRPDLSADAVLALAAKRSGGSVGAAIKLISDLNYETVDRRLTEVLTAVKAPGGVSAVSGNVQQLKDHGRLIASMLEVSASELMARENADIALTPLSKALSALGVDGARLMEQVISFRSMLESNVSFQNAFEMLLYNITTGDN